MMKNKSSPPRTDGCYIMAAYQLRAGVGFFVPTCMHSKKYTRAEAQLLKLIRSTLTMATNSTRWSVRAAVRKLATKYPELAPRT
jgi:hypothetical protein